MTSGLGRRQATGAVLVFDVLGSLLDEDTAQRAQVRALLNMSETAENRFLTGWSARFRALVVAIQDGREDYRIPEELHRQAVVETADDQSVHLTEQAAAGLARFGRTLAPFPDVPDALEALARSHALVALTNAGSAQAFAMSRNAGLRWTTLLSGEVVRAYKPDPRMYRTALAVLDIDPPECVFVAAHRWDLDAAGEHGMRTAYLNRSGDNGGAEYDFVGPDLAALVSQLH